MDLETRGKPGEQNGKPPGQDPGVMHRAWLTHPCCAAPKSPQLPSSSAVLKRHLVPESSGDESHEHSLVPSILEFLIQWL